MDSIGAEVGQKMRSAIKAKLMELDRYVDDELPDYIMVMVANRRTKSQMNEDLNLFLSTKTSAFVNWLHIVLKKLKEVTVTNPDVYKKAMKRKSSETAVDDKNNIKIKKEKNHKKVKREPQIDRPVGEAEESGKETSSITDNLPIVPNKMSEFREIVVSNNKIDVSGDNIVDDNFDIPLLSEVSDSVNEQELQDIEEKIRNVKNRLGILVESDTEEGSVAIKSENGNFIIQSKPQIENERNILANTRQISILNDEIAGSEDKDTKKSTSLVNPLSQNRDIEVDSLDDEMNLENTGKLVKKPQHKRITFDVNSEPVTVKSKLDRTSDLPLQAGSKYSFTGDFSAKNSTEKRRSILERLGKRLISPDRNRRSEYRSNEDRVLINRSGDVKKRSSSGDRDKSNRLSERLGIDIRNRGSSKDRNRSKSRDRSPLRSKDRNIERDSKREGILNRVGVRSKISVIEKPILNQKSDDEEELVVREVQSSIKVKPRVISNRAVQPNKNLLLKAMAEAQRSIAQAPKVGKDVKPDNLYTKKYSEKHRKKQSNNSTEQRDVSLRKLPEEEKNKLKDIIKHSSSRMRSRINLSSDEYDSDGEYIPKPPIKTEKDGPSYIPSFKSGSESELKENETKESGKQQFIITLDGVEKFGFVDTKPSEKLRLDTTTKKRSSPIVFEKTKDSATESKTSRSDIPDKLLISYEPLSAKQKEKFSNYVCSLRCRYWPGCRQGDKCEFYHPPRSCQQFPHCKFGEKCMFSHPKCKFGSSCTKKECPYDHSVYKTAMSSKLPVSTPVMQNCKFFPNCVNGSCPFYHPKPCKYGKYCNNISECSFSHALVISNKNMSWRSK